MKALLKSIGWGSLWGLSVLLTNTALAEVPDEVDVNNPRLNQGLREQLYEKVAFPDFLKSRTGKRAAKVFFKIDDSGKISVLQVLTDDKELRTYLASSMEGMKADLSPEILKPGVYSILMTFTVL